ncbi:hypothetical protein [Ichthyobacterium seriolicida]|uniref:DUF5018 domain-containing protein n=1 Tax=Ichthyobacterium seriolicida TaxID=242600 RepID=A0A1J1E3Q1_9FLAO|nr:hypothetical protein [Ichthyobacterium seriolicida]BAV94676.1 hypothetical protein JBKA6_0663 [Ichthyobacterium seriolicida]
MNLKFNKILLGMIFVGTMLSCDKKDKVERSDKNQITSVKLEKTLNASLGIKGTELAAKEITAGTNKYYIALLANGATIDNTTKVKPTIAISDKATIDPKNKIEQTLGVVKPSAASPDLSQSGVEYTVTAEDGTSKSKYRIIALKAPKGVNATLASTKAPAEGNTAIDADVDATAVSNSDETITFGG